MQKDDKSLQNGTGPNLLETARRPAPVRSPSAPRERPRPRAGRIALLTVALACGIGAGAFAAHRKHTAAMVAPIASVNGAPIEKPKFYAALEREAGPGTLRQMVNEEIQLQYAAQKGSMPSEQQVNDKYVERMKALGATPGKDRPRMTEAEFKRGIRVELSQANALTQGVSVTDDEVRRYYDAQSSPNTPNALFFRPQTIEVAVIVTPTEQKAQEAFAALRSGMKWGDAARKFSIDDSRNRQGLMPIIAQGRSKVRQVPGMEAALFSMKNGGFLGPRKFANAWWLIRCVKIQPESRVSFEEARDMSRQGALMKKGAELNGSKLEKDFQEYRKQANVQAFWKQYQNALKSP